MGDQGREVRSRPTASSRVPIVMPRMIVATSRKWALTMSKAIQFQYAERDLARRRPGGSRPARACRSSGSRRRCVRQRRPGCRCTRRSRPRRGRRSARATTSGSDSVVTSTTRSAPRRRRAVERVRPVSATMTCRAPRRSTSWCTRLPMKPAPMMHDVVAEPHVGRLHRVGRAGQRLGQGRSKRAPRARPAVRGPDGDVVGEAAAGHPDAHRVARPDGRGPRHRPR